MRRFLVVPAILLTLVVSAFGQGNSLTVDAKANIYAAGRGIAFNGVVPPAMRFAAGPGKVVTFPVVSGTIACNGIAYEPLHSPDGTVNRCGGTGTSISSWAGISGIVHKTREMFLVGVFLDEREPADPAPDSLDFSTTENYSSLSPLIGQVFFIGDGRTSSSGSQQVTAPAAATRLYLGFADAVGFSGAPYAYNDNNGSLQVTIAGVTPYVPGPVATGTSMTVNGKSSIFWSGLEVNWPTEMPPGWKFTAAPGRIMTVRASRSVTCKTGISAPPDGTADCGAKTDIEPWGAVSGIKHPSRSMFLVGVFLNDLKPRGWPPTALDFTNDSFTTLEPLIGQTFYIGSGTGKRFVVPHDATRVFLGYARSDQMTGTAGWYQQGGGSLTASIDLTAGTTTAVSPVQVDAKSNLYAAGRETAFDGYLPPMVRLTPGPGKVLTVPQVSGKVRCCGGGYTTADGAPYQTNLNAYGGLSGIEAKWRGYFLAAVFLDDKVPDGAPPEKLVFTEPFDFPSLAPKTGQVFLIGDGLRTNGVPHEFTIPATATRLYLGFAMGRLFNGDPGSYWEASDSYTATLNIGGGTAPTCTYALSETARSMPAAAGTGSVTVTTAAGCGWTAASGAAWITVTSGATGSGTGTVGYSVTANAGAARTGTLTIAGQTYTISQAAGTTSCTYSINPATQAVAASGGTVTVQVAAGAGCTWTAVSNTAWLTVSAGASGTGSATVTLTASANTGAQRSGTATIGGQTATFNQAAGSSTSTVEITDVVNDADATPNFAPGGTVLIRGRNFAAATQQLDASVLWPNSLDGVSVEVTDSGRTLAAPVGGVSPGWVYAQLPFGLSSTVTLRVVSPSGRSAATSISVATRNPRLYTVDGSGQGSAWAYHADGRQVTTSAPAKPGEEILILGAGFGAVTPAVAAGQLGIDPTGGAEPNRVSDTVEVELQGITVHPRLAILDYFLVAAYSVVFTVPDQITSTSPSLLVRVGGVSSQRDVTLPAQPGTACTYTVTPLSAQVPAAGGSGNFSVTAASTCSWTATSSQTWLTVTSGASGKGNGTVTLTAAPNPGVARSATATIAGQTVTVNQAAGTTVCTYAVDPTGFSVYHLAYQDSFQIVTAAGCAWTAVSDSTWLRITSAASGTGPARVTFEVSANPAMTERTGLISVGTVKFTIRQMGALATFEVDAKSNIFAAGRATAFNGLLPPGYRFTAGAGKVLALDAVNGATHCQNGTATIPADGTAFCVSGSTDVSSYQGIGGIVHGRKVMFLVGVFLDDREPADPAPARLDFTNNEDYTSLTPLIGQVFFLGNGRTASNAQQTVVVPATATRLFLGFADAEAFHGAPGAYQDNVGGLTVNLRVAPGSSGGGGGDGGGTGLMIDAKSNIFASGRATAFDGLLPPSVRLATGTNRIVTVTNATGTVRCSSGSAAMGPDGGTECSSNGTDLTSYQGISGVIHSKKTMFLVGVFLTDAEPADPSPPRLDFSNNEGFATLAPAIGQTFFIGDGMTGTGTGAAQQFAAPDPATRLFLGFADGYSLHGAPGYYGDNSGSLSVTVTGGTGSGGGSCSYTVSPTTLTVPAAGGTNTITLTTTATCAWTAASNAAWARVTSSASGTGPATVSVTVDANTGAARTGTLTIAGQTVTVNQAAGGGGSTCTYSIAPGSASFTAAGGTGRIDVTTQSGCAWTATANATWITFTPGQSGTGSGTVNYAVAANTGTSNRLGTISVGGKNHPVEQTGSAPPSTVTITPGGVVDTASFSTGLAPGSLFSVFGNDLAAATKQADGLPLPTSLDGVTVEVTDSAGTSKTPLFFVSPGQVNGQFPYTLKGASVQVRVRNNKGDSAPVTVAIEARAPRLFPWETNNAIVVHNDYRLVTAQAPVQPGEYLIAFLVGMGAVDPPVAAGAEAGDGIAAPLNRITETVSVSLGGQAATVVFAGLAPHYVGLYQVNFQAPATVRPGPAALEVRVGPHAVQSGLFVACGAAWTKTVEQAVGPAGATITTSAFSMTVPPGAVGTSSTWTFSSGSAAAPESGQLGPWWRWQGIPREIRSPITYTLPKGTSLPAGTAFLVVRPVHGKGELRVPLQDQGGVWTATIPPRQQPPATSDAGSSSGTTLAAATRNPAANSADWQFDEAYLALFPAWVDDGSKVFGAEVWIHPKSLDALEAAGLGADDALAKGLLRAWEKLKLLGFGTFEKVLWPTLNGQRIPIIAFVEPPGSGIFRNSEHYVAPTYWNDRFLLLIDPAILLQLRDGFPIEDNIAAETAALFATQLHYSVSDKFPAWSWWGKAVADTAEDLLNCRHSASPKADEIRAMLTNGLENDGKDAIVAGLLGASARSFVEYLLLWEKLTLPGEMLAPQYTSLASPWPTDLLRILLSSRGLGQRWLEFVEDWGRGQRHLDCAAAAPGKDPELGKTPDPYLLSLQIDVARKVTATTRGATVDVSLPDLSARPILIALPKASEVEDEMILSLVFPPPQNADDQVRMRVAALDADGKVVSAWKLVSTEGRVQWDFKQGDRLWIWVVQSRFGKPGELTNVQVVLKLTPKDQTPPATPPWAGPGPENFYFDSFVPMLVSTKLDFTGIQVWSTDYNATLKWSYPYNFSLTAPSRTQYDTSPSLTITGTVDASRKVAQATIDAKRGGSETLYSRLQVTLRDLPCTYREDGDYYHYTCEVTAAALRDNSATYVNGFSEETWSYNFTTKRWESKGISGPDFKTLNPSTPGWNSPVLAVRFRGHL